MGDTHPIFEEDSFPFDSLWQSNENPNVEMMILGRRCRTSEFSSPHGGISDRDEILKSYDNPY